MWLLNFFKIFIRKSWYFLFLWFDIYKCNIWAKLSKWALKSMAVNLNFCPGLFSIEWENSYKCTESNSALPEWIHLAPKGLLWCTLIQLLTYEEEWQGSTLCWWKQDVSARNCLPFLVPCHACMQIRMVVSNSPHGLQNCKAFVIQNCSDMFWQETKSNRIRTRILWRMDFTGAAWQRV